MAIFSRNFDPCSVGRDVTAEEASVVGPPRALRVEEARAAEAGQVGEASGLGLGGDDVTLAALRAVTVGLL